MPPQQGDGLLDLFDGAFGFGAHGVLVLAGGDIGSVRGFVKAGSGSV
jgi:hypothetical protein